MVREQQEFYDYEQSVRYRLRDRVYQMDEDIIRHNSVEDVVSSLEAEAVLPRIDKDASRSVQANPRTIKGTPDYIIFDVTYPVVHHRDLRILLSLRTMPMYAGPFDFDYHDGNITFRCEPHELDAHLAELEAKIIDSRNRRVAEFNNMLRQHIQPHVEARKRQLAEKDEKYQQALKSIKSAIVIGPVETAIVKRTLYRPDSPKKAASLPPLQTKPTTPDWSLDQEYLMDILGAISRSGRQFEITPQTFIALGEAGMRDTILTNLNTQFKGATGETFNKKGKTDIRLEADGGGIFVAECKIWDGTAKYHETVEQLFRYLTWRETHGAVISFDTSKEMTANITKVGEYIRKCGVEPEAISGSHLVSLLKHPEDHGKTVTVHHLFFHLANKS